MQRRPHSFLPHLAGRAARGLGLALVGGAAGWIAYSRFGINHRQPLPPALPGRLQRLRTAAGAVNLYDDGLESGVPLLLIHSVNAAASAYEVRPLYRHYARSRPVYALDLPGFGFSERRRQVYTPGVMVEAIHAVRRRSVGGTAPCGSTPLLSPCRRNTSHGRLWSGRRTTGASV